MQGQEVLHRAPEGTEEVKGRVRYHYAIKFARAQMGTVAGDDMPITMRHPVVLHAASRYRLDLPQVRRLVSELRKDRDGF